MYAQKRWIRMITVGEIDFRGHLLLPFLVLVMKWGVKQYGQKWVNNFHMDYHEERWAPSEAACPERCRCSWTGRGTEGPPSCCNRSSQFPTPLSRISTLRLVACCIVRIVSQSQYSVNLVWCMDGLSVEIWKMFWIEKWKKLWRNSKPCM